MSTTIDQKVVEMRFDNRHFERNVSGTMSTLDKLKQKLNLSGAAKGLDNIGASAKKVDMTGLSRGVESVTAKFSSLQVVGVTALSNLTNSAMNYAKNIVRSLTVAPVSDGFQEYEMTLNAVQTTMAATGKTAKDVEVELKKLDEYADKTVYGTADMLNNLPKFTNAGVELEKATKAMIGIANATALAGGDAGKASIAFYNLGQAIGTGYLTRMDYNSINNAGIATMEWKNQMVEAAIAQGTLTKVGEDAYRAGNKTLTLQQLFIDGLQEQWATTDVMMKVFEDYGNETTEVGKKAYAAAQDIKTYSMMMESLKATAGTGWKDTWQIIFGDLDAAKKFWTGLTNTISGVITKMADVRNFFLEAVLNFTEPWTNITDKLGNIKKVVETVQDFTDKLEYFQNVVNDVWRGDYKNSDTGRYELLEKAGYDHRVVQDLVNKGYQYKITVEDIEASHKKFGLTMETTTEETKEITSAINELTEEQLKEAGLTEYEIWLYKDLQREAERTGKSVSELADEMSKTSGRTLLINSFKNIGGGLISIFKAIGQAWREIFDPISIVGVYNMLKSFKNMTVSFKRSLGVFDETTGEFVRLSEKGEKLKSTFKGIFAILDVVTTLLSGGLKIAFKLLIGVLKYFNVDILDVTANIGDALVAFRDWFDSIFDVSKILDKIVPALKKGAGTIKKWFDAFVNLPEVQEAISRFSAALEKLTSADIGGKIQKLIKSFLELPLVKDILDALGVSLENLEDTDLSGIGKNIVDGLVKGLKTGVKDAVTGIINIGTKIVEAICNFLGIHSPSTVFMAIGGFIIAGLLLGLKEGFISVPESMQGIVDKCLEVIQNIDWGAVFAIGVSVAALYFLKKIGDALEILAAPLEGLTNLFNEAAGLLNSLSFEIKTKAIKNLAISLAILVGAVLGIVLLCGNNYAQMWNAVGVVAALAGILVGLAIATNMLSDSSLSFEKGKLDIDGIKQNLLTIAAAIGILGLTVKLLGSMKTDQYIQGMLGMVAAASTMVLLLFICNKIADGNSAKKLDVIGGIMLKLSFAMLLMAGVVKMIGLLSVSDIIKGVAFTAGFMLFIATLSKISESSGRNINKLGGTMIKLTIAMGLMVGVLKLVSLLNAEDMIKGVIFAGAFALFVKTLLAVTKKDGNAEIAKVTGLLLSISLSMALMVGVCKLVGKLSSDEMKKGAIFAGAFVIFVGALVAVTKIASDKQIAKVGGTIIAIAAAIGILAMVSMLLSLMSIEGLVKGVVAVSILAGMMTLMIKSLKGAQNVKGSLLMMTIAIGVMAGAVAALSLIKVEKLAVATAAMTALMGMFALVIRSSKNIGKAIGPLIVMTVAIGVMAGALILLSKLGVENALANAGALSLLMTAMVGCLFILSKVGKVGLKALGGILLLTAMVLPLWLFAKVLSGMNSLKGATINVILLITLMSALTILLPILAIVGNFGWPAIIGILALTAMAVPMLAFIGVLTLMDGIKNATKNVFALINLMSTMAILLPILVIVGALWIPAAIGILALTAMAVPMLAFVGVLALMNKVQNAANNAALLIGLMTVMTTLLTHLAIIGPLALIGVTALQGLVIVMAEFIILAGVIGWLMDVFPSIEKFLDTGLPVLEKLAGSLGRMIGNFIGGIGEGLSNSLVTIGENLCDFMWYLREASEEASGIDGSSFDGVLQLIEALAGVALVSMGMSIADVFTRLLGDDKSAMDKFAEDAEAFFDVMADISEASKNCNIPNDLSFEGVISLLDALKQIASYSTITSVMDFFINSFSDKDAVDKFAEDAVALIAAMHEIYKASTEDYPFGDGFTFPTTALSAVLNGLKAVADCMGDMTLSEIASRLTSGGDAGTVQKFATDAVALIEAMHDIYVAATVTYPFGDGFTFPTTALSAVLNGLKKVSECMVGMTFSELCSRIATDFESGTVKKFADDSVELIKAMKRIYDATLIYKFGDGFTFPTLALSAILNGLAKVSEHMEQATMSELCSKLATFGDQGTMEKFSTDVTNFFSAMSTAANAANNNEYPTSFPTTALTAILDGLKAVAEYTKGTVWDDLLTIGGTSMENFKTNSTTFFDTLKDLSDKGAGINTENINKAKTAVDKFKQMIEATKGIDDSGVAKFTGIGTGGAGADGPIHDIAVAIKDFGDTLSGVNTESISNSVSTATKIKNLINSLVSVDTSGISNFKATEIATSIKSYSDTVSGINSSAITTSINAIKSLIDLIKKMNGMTSGGVQTFKNAISQLSTVSLSGLEQTFNASATKIANIGSNLVDFLANGMKSNQGNLIIAMTAIINAVLNDVKTKLSVFKTSGENTMKSFISGITSKKSDVSSAYTSVLSSAVTDIRNKYHSFYDAGAYVVSGFANGISANSYKASAKAKAMAVAAKEAAEKALGIASPSKVFETIGNFTGEGFVNGLSDFISTASSVASALGDSATDGLSGAIGKVVDYFTSDVDVQPTITPVVDLSEVKSGADAINGMLNNNSLLSAQASVSTINSSMNNNQNGANSEIVSAINKLRKDLENVGNTTYEINGVTYDDGSAIQDAFFSVMRQARIERRV